MSIILNKTDNNIRTKLMELNLKKINKSGPSYNWTKQEDQIIRNIAYCEYINKKDKFELLCNLLERKDGAIYSRIGKLKLREYFSKGYISNLEIIIKNFLDKNNIKYIQQYLLPDSLYKVDFFIKNKNLIIEVLGNYWHCNPIIYQNGPIDNIQKLKIESDKTKFNFIKNKKYNLFYIWENDIYHNYEKIKINILNYIKQC